MTEISHTFDAWPHDIFHARMIVKLAPTTAVAAIAPIEVMVQAGVKYVALDAHSHLELQQLSQIFSGRVAFGLHGVREPDEMDTAIEFKAAFVMLGSFLPELAERCTQASIPVTMPAMTPNEIEAVKQFPVAGIEVTPIDVFTANYARRIPVMFADDVVIPSGGINTSTAISWLNEGCRLVAVDPDFVGNDLGASDLASLRRSMVSLVDAVGKASPPPPPGQETCCE